MKPTRAQFAGVALTFFAGASATLWGAGPEGRSAPGQAAPVTATEEQRTALLVYSDLSPGTLPHGLVWKMVAEDKGKQVISTADADEFALLLPTQDWWRVVVAARYSPGEPVYAKALRQYVERGGRRRALMYFWHDNGTQPDPSTIVAAPMAVVLWNHNMTTTSYSDVPFRTYEESRPRTVAGYCFPGFDGLELTDPEVISLDGARYAKAMEPGPVPLPPQTCDEKCLRTWKDAVDRCDESYDGDRADCDDLYGEDPEQHAECVANANEMHTGCMNNAAYRYKKCVARCFKQTGPDLG